MCVLLEVWSFDFSTNCVRACVWVCVGVCGCVWVCVGVCGCGWAGVWVWVGGCLCVCVCDVNGQRYQLWFMFYGMEHTH